jgi:hypothetical protein
VNTQKLVFLGSGNRPDWENQISGGEIFSFLLEKRAVFPGGEILSGIPGKFSISNEIASF